MVGSVKDRLDEIIRGVAGENQVEVLALEIMPDHLHLFISTNPDVSIQKLIQLFKGRSSHHLRREFPELLKIPSLWTHSYFISTAGKVSSETIQRYIEEQSKK